MKEIKLSNKKIILLFFASLSFTIFSIFFILFPEKFVSFIFFSERFIKNIGYIGSLFFGLACILLFTKLFDKKPGLIINKDGIIDNSNFSSVGLISWSDILNIESKKVVSSDFLLLKVKNPEEYISRVSYLKRILLRKNFETYNTPITITSAGLECNFKELEKIILDNYLKYK